MCYKYLHVYSYDSYAYLWHIHSTGTYVCIHVYKKYMHITVIGYEHNYVCFFVGVSLLPCLHSPLRIGPLDPCHGSDGSAQSGRALTTFGRYRSKGFLRHQQWSNHSATRRVSISGVCCRKFSFAGAFSEGLAQHVRNQMLDRNGTPCQEVLGYSTETILSPLLFQGQPITLLVLE